MKTARAVLIVDLFVHRPPRQTLDEDKAPGWTVVSMKDDWKRIYSPCRSIIEPMLASSGRKTIRTEVRRFFCAGNGR